MKKTTLSIAAIAAFLGQASVAAEIVRDDATRPIIAQMLNNPDAYTNKPVTIYGLVIARYMPELIGTWPTLAQTLVYLVLGVIWLLPLKRFLIWMETGRTGTK